MRRVHITLDSGHNGLTQHGFSSHAFVTVDECRQLQSLCFGMVVPVLEEVVFMLGMAMHELTDSINHFERAMD